MERLGIVLESFGRPDSAGWMALCRSLPGWAGALLVALGALLWSFGNRPLPSRLGLAPVLALGGLFAGPVLAGLAGLAPGWGRAIAPGALGLAALAWPPAGLFLAGAAGGGLLGGLVAGSANYWFGFVPGALLVGATAAIARNVAASLGSAATSGAFVALGAASALSNSAMGTWLLARPVVVAGGAACIALGSAVWLVGFAPTEKERRRRAAERQRTKELAAEARKRDQRFESYGTRKPRAG